MYNKVWLLIWTVYTQSEELRFAQRTFALVALREPFHYAVSMEFLAASLAALLGELATTVHNVEANRALLNSRQLLVDIVLPEEDAVDDGIVSVVKLALQHKSPSTALLDLQPLPELYVYWSK